MLTFVHGNRVGTGSCLTVEMIPATTKKHGIVDFVLYPQSKTGDKTGDNKQARHSFSKKDKVYCSLDPTRISRFISVLCGEENSTNGGIVIKDSSMTRIFHIDRVSDPFEGFAIHIVNDDYLQKREARIILNLSEGRALYSSIESSMGVIAFGK